MEEKVLNNGANKKETPSIEQLQETVKQYQNQLNIMYQRIQEMNMANLFRRLDYLFKVVENHEVFSLSFIDKCVKEIEEALTASEEEEAPASNN